MSCLQLDGLVAQTTHMMEYSFYISLYSLGQNKIVFNIMTGTGGLSVARSALKVYGLRHATYSGGWITANNIMCLRQKDL